MPQPRFIVGMLMASVGLASVAGSLGARELAIGFAPEFPTWRDPVTLTISGEGFCVDEAPGEPVVTGSVIEIDFNDHCVIGTPPGPFPFSVSTELGPLVPGTYTVRVNDLLESDVEEAELTIYEVSVLEVSHRPEILTDEDPITFIVRGVGCYGGSNLGVVGSRLELEVSNSCDFGGVPPEPTVFERKVTFDPVPAGEYELRILEVLHSGAEFYIGLPPEVHLATSSRQLTVHDAQGCVSSASVLCLHGGRFRIEASWRDFKGATGQGRALVLPEIDDTGFFWFFEDDNVELTVKVLRGCPVNGHWWVFLSSGSTVEYTVTVTDLESDLAPRVYLNSLRHVPGLIPDTTAFPSCP